MANESVSQHSLDVTGASLACPLASFICIIRQGPVYSTYEGVGAFLRYK